MIKARAAVALAATCWLLACGGGEATTGASTPPAPTPIPIASTPPAALAQAPSINHATDRADDLIDVAAALPDVVLDLRYATTRNFTGAVIYPTARCLLRRAAIERLRIAVAELKRHERRLLLWDCYRPFSVQQQFWARVHDERYVAKPVADAAGHPVSGSRHNRGAAIDASLAALDGTALAMPTDHDDFSMAAHRTTAQHSAAAGELAILDAALTGAGFVGIATEWWHYDAPGGDAFPLEDVPLTTP